MRLGYKDLHTEECGIEGCVVWVFVRMAERLLRKRDGWDGGRSLDTDNVEIQESIHFGVEMIHRASL